MVRYNKDKTFLLPYFSSAGPGTMCGSDCSPFQQPLLSSHPTTPPISAPNDPTLVFFAREKPKLGVHEVSLHQVIKAYSPLFSPYRGLCSKETKKLLFKMSSPKTPVLVNCVCVWPLLILSSTPGLFVCVIALL